MADSILNSTKKILGLGSDYTVFDVDVITHINMAFSVLDQLGIGPAGGFSIVDDEETWDDFIVPQNQLNMVRTYVFLKVRQLFDPPSTSYLIEAMSRQVQECEYRLNVFRENIIQEASNVVGEEVP